MKFPGRGNAVPIALGVLAVVVAGSGTAVAVSATTTISDPAVPSQIAHVDAAGQLLTTSVPVTSTLSIASSFFNSGVTFLTSSTRADIAITQLLLSETRLNGTVAGSDLTVSLVQLAVNADGSCSPSVGRTLATSVVSSGDHVDLASSSTPLVATPNGRAKYCLGLQASITDGQADNTPFFPKFAFAGYVASGIYNGPGTSAAPGAVAGAVPPDTKTR